MGTFNLSYNHAFSGFLGELIPVQVQEVLPGDVFRGRTDVMLRMPPLAAPLMHRVHVRIGHFFVPNRITWADWEDFITGKNGEDDTLPTSNASTTLRLTQYLGAPKAANGTAINALPIFAYNTIYNEFYRDQDLQTPVSIYDKNVLRVGWEKDYFTIARATPQQGTAEAIGVSGTLQADGPLTVTDGNNINHPLEVGTAAAPTGVQIGTSSASGIVPGTELQYSGGLSVGGTSIDINQLRQAIALQRRKEHRAKYGSRYEDLLASLGIRPRDGRLQRPEYLGGGSTSFNFSEVVSTAQGTTVAVGDLFGHGVAMLSHRPFRRVMPEHGYVLTLVSVRPQTQYMNGLPRHLMRSTPSDFWHPEAEIQGPQEIYNREVHAAHTTPTGVFGYTARHQEYRGRFSQVSDDLDDDASPWHFARNIANTAALNDDFIKCVPSDRPFQDETKITGLAINNLMARRPVSQFPMV